MTLDHSRSVFEQWLIGVARYLAHLFYWWTSHSYRVWCDYESCQDHGPIAYMWVGGERREQKVREYNGSAYLMADGLWYGPQDIKEIVTLSWHAGGSK